MADEAADTTDSTVSRPAWLLWWGQVAAQPVLAGGLVAVLVLLALTGWLGWRSHDARQSEQLADRYVEAGRVAAQHITSIGFESAEADVQRVLDVTTGTFRDDFEQGAQPFIDAVRQTQSTTVGTVGAVGLESQSGDHALVLAAVTVHTSNAGVPEPAPRAWRMRLTVEQVDGQAKVSDVEFVQ